MGFKSAVLESSGDNQITSCGSNFVPPAYNGRPYYSIGKYYNKCETIAIVDQENPRAVDPADIISHLFVPNIIFTIKRFKIMFTFNDWQEFTVTDIVDLCYLMCV